MRHHHLQRKFEVANLLGLRQFRQALLDSLTPSADLPTPSIQDIFKMGAAASVRAGEEIASSIARTHPTLCEKKNPTFTKFFRHYSRKGAMGSVFPNDNEAYKKFLPFERLKQPITSSVSVRIAYQK